MRLAKMRNKKIPDTPMRSQQAIPLRPKFRIKFTVLNPPDNLVPDNETALDHRANRA